MYKLGNLTIILPSYNCDRNCPFCIVKNNRKFNSIEDLNLNALKKALEKFRQNGIHFERIVLSGNGEPSLYNYEQLQSLAEILKANSDIFDVLRIHSSGNIFFEKNKFDLFNQLLPDVEFDILRVAIDPKKDMQVLGYTRDYTQTEEFRRANRIKFDIGLTKYLNQCTFAIDLDNLLKSHSNVQIIRFKNLMSGEHEESIQAKWVRDTRMSKEEFLEFLRSMLSYYRCSSVDNLDLATDRVIKFENSGNYPRDAVFSKGIICDYSENPISISTLQNMASIVDKSKSLKYDELGG